MHLSRRIFIACLISALALPVLGQPDQDRQIKSIAEEQLESYWVLAPDLMAAVLPPSARGISEILQREGKVVAEFDVTIDEEGVPISVRLISISPDHVNPKPFIAGQLLRRYRPGESNPGSIPVHVKLTVPYFIPNSRAAAKEQ
mgnify:CR=1 FL=1|jgi:hypothetical protein